MKISSYLIRSHRHVSTSIRPSCRVSYHFTREKELLLRGTRQSQYNNTFRPLSFGRETSADPMRMYHETAPRPLQKLRPKPHKVLIVGGCYAGLSAATNLLDLCEGRAPRFVPRSKPTQQKVPIDITIVDERDGFYHVIGSPLALASSSYAQKAWIKFHDVPGLQHPAVNIVHGSVTKVDLGAKIATIVPNDSTGSVQHKYDYLVAASGLRRVWPVVPQQLKRKDYLKEAHSHMNAVKEAEQGS